MITIRGHERPSKRLEDKDLQKIKGHKRTSQKRGQRPEKLPRTLDKLGKSQEDIRGHHTISEDKKGLIFPSRGQVEDYTLVHVPGHLVPQMNNLRPLTSNVPQFNKNTGFPVFHSKQQGLSGSLSCILKSGFKNK